MVQINALHFWAAKQLHSASVCQCRYDDSNIICKVKWQIMCHYLHTTDPFLSIFCVYKKGNMMG